LATVPRRPGVAPGQFRVKASSSLRGCAWEPPARERGAAGRPGADASCSARGSCAPARWRGPSPGRGAAARPCRR